MCRRHFGLTLIALLLGLQAPPRAAGQAPAVVQPAPAGRANESRPAPLPQTRPHGLRVPIDPAKIFVDDGDTVEVRWSKNDLETVRILGIEDRKSTRLNSSHQLIS